MASRRRAKGYKQSVIRQQAENQGGDQSKPTSSLFLAKMIAKPESSLTPSLTYIMHAICRRKIRLFWCFYGVTYNFIQNHNHWRDLHHFFSCLFETFGTMSEIMFSSDSISTKKNQQLKIHECLLLFTTYYCFGMVGKQWFKIVRMAGISSFTIADSN